MAEIAYLNKTSQAHNSTSPIFLTGQFQRKNLVPSEDGRLRYVDAPSLSSSPSPSPSPRGSLPQGTVWQADAIPSGSPGFEHWQLSEDQRNTLRSFRHHSPIGSADQGASGNDRESGAAPLVHNAKSPRKKVNAPPYAKIPLGKPETFFQVYHQDVILVRPGTPYPNPSPDGSCRAAIYEFSKKSERALDHICRNSGHRIRSQFCMTYHENPPSDGLQTKDHLERFLKRLYRYAPGVSYLWVLEFQANRVPQAPHFHLFLTCRPDKELQKKLSRAWVEITEGSETQYRWHTHWTNFKEWEMKNGEYVKKQYCVKSAQKTVPQHYRNVGRFYGCSRDMIPKTKPVTADKITAPNWESAAIIYYFSKCLKKYQEKNINYDIRSGKRWTDKNGKVQKWKKPSLRRSYDNAPLAGAFNIKGGTKIFAQLLDYVKNNPPDPLSLMAAMDQRVPF